MFYKMINHQCPGYLSNLVSTQQTRTIEDNHMKVIPAHQIDSAHSTTQLTACKSVKVCQTLFRIQTKKYTF